MISVCIPTKNARPEFARNLQAWRTQRLGEETELVVVDSGSRDTTVETARALGARVLTILPEDYNHGETRNLLARQARGDLLVFTVQDAWPVNHSTLDQLTNPLRQDPGLAGVTGKQVPRPDADFIAHWEVDIHNLHFDKGRRTKRMTSLEDFLRGDFLARFDCLAFDNVCAAIRRTAWQQFPFSRVSFAEDLDWSFRVLAAGGYLLHNPAAQVYHSHNRAPYQRLKRYFVARRATNRIFRMPPEFDSLRGEEGLRDIGAFLADLVQLRAKLPQPTQLLGELHLPRSFRHLLRQALRRSGLPGGQGLARRIRGGLIHDLLRHSFNYAASLLCQSHGPLSPTQAAEAIVQLGSQQLGDLLGRYYHSCELREKVPDWLEEMGSALGRGV